MDPGRGIRTILKQVDRNSETVQAKDGSLFFVNGWGNIYRAPPGSLATQTHPGNEAAAQTDVSRAAKAAPGRDEGAQTFGFG